MSILHTYQKPSATHQHKPSPVRAPIFAALEQTKDYYRYHLSKNELAREYLYRRGFDDAIINKFEIGLSPNGYNQLLAQANNKVWRSNIQRSLTYSLNQEQLTDTIHALLEMGGVLKINPSGEMSDRFRERIIFPIKNSNGDTVSFGGRHYLPEKFGPKYLNGSDSAVFKKHNVIFGANFLKPDSHYDSIIVSEGYMDVATMHQFGIENSVGTMGTAIASGQIESLFEFTNHLIFCFDGDEAGTKAANRAVKNARQTLSGNRKVSVVFLPDGHDPDSILRKDTNGTPLTPQLIQDGVDSFFQLLDNAISIENYLAQLALTELNVEWGENMQQVMAHLLNDSMMTPSDSEVGKNLLNFVKNQAHSTLLKQEGVDNDQLVDWVKQHSI
ncbi:toprim domain-containing protein [Vibrio anguillarum]|uniref:toprim domain-containing protein n=1 Tax=Vibrio anguillarum TaxID=55601 RepID=UPI000BB45D88|nr:toprim domain-containing protein [Vibrio anguillarum]ATC60271.1 hypothetical protein CMV05_23055 [Vibrio anguillarum]